MTNRGTRNRIRKEFNVNDYISLLPDEILLIILSLLEDSSEAARTSILSTRWRNLWKFLSSLNIDGSKCLKNATTRIFVKTVYQILGQHRAQIIDELAIRYPSSAVHRKLHFFPNNLIDIAIRKKVRALKLHFCHIPQPPLVPPLFGSSAFSSLVTLHLIYISLSSEMISCILSDCPNLEELSIFSGRGFLESLSIGGSGSSLRLKRLELVLSNIEFLEISAPKLASLYFMRLEFFPVTQICFKDVPLLTNLWYRGKGTDFCVLLAQLESLTLVSPSEPSPAADQIPDFLVLKNLKQMYFRFRDDKHGGLHWFLRIFEASPCLCRLTLKLDCEDMTVSSALKHYSKQDECVEVIEINNFNGWDNEVELVLCIAQSCSSLRKIIIRFNDILKWEEGCVKLKSAVCKLQALLTQPDLQFQLEGMRRVYANMCRYIQLCVREWRQGKSSFWFDPCVQREELWTQLFPNLNILDSDIPKKSKVKNVWRRGSWYLLNPFDSSTSEAWNLISGIPAW